MDDFDRAILRIVQRDNSLSHREIGARVGLSNSAVRRRIGDLQAAGVISGNVALVDPKASLVTFIIHVAFAVDTVEAYEALDALVQSDDHIKQAYHVSGPTDYILVVQGPSLAWYEAWAKATLMSQDSLKRHDTSVVYTRKKFDTSVPI